MPSVDVYVPCYNYGRFLRGCVESVLHQEGVDVRVLILDDASTDDTPEIGRALAKEDRRVEYRRHAANRGHIATYNEGIDWTAADYQLLLSADDMLTPGAFRRATEVLDRFPDIGFVFGRGVTTADPATESVTDHREFEYKVIDGSQFWAISCRTANNIVSTPTAVVRTAIQKRIGGYRPELPHTGDLEMWMRFAAHGRVGVLNAEQGFYRVHGKNMHVETFTGRMTILDQHRLAFEGLFREYGGRIAESEQLQHQALRTLAVGAVRRAGVLFEQGDTSACQGMLDAALSLDPTVSREQVWRRTRWKQRLGVTLSRTLTSLRRLVNRSRPLDRDPFGRSGIFDEI